MTLINIFIYLSTVILCYYINRAIIRKYGKHDSIYDWEHVRINLIISFTIIFSILYWICVFVARLPTLPKEPPRWL